MGCSCLNINGLKVELKELIYSGRNLGSNYTIGFFGDSFFCGIVVVRVEDFYARSEKLRSGSSLLIYKKFPDSFRDDVSRLIRPLTKGLANFPFYDQIFLPLSGLSKISSRD